MLLIYNVSHQKATQLLVFTTYYEIRSLFFSVYILSEFW